MVYTDTLEEALSSTNIGVGGTMGCKTLIDIADEVLRWAIAVSCGVGRAVGREGNPGVQALRKDAWA